MACAAVYLLWATRGSGFFLDEWILIDYRLGFSAVNLFAPEVDHLVAIPALLYQVAVKTFGLDAAHLPIRLLWVGLILGSSLLLFVYLRRRTLAWFAFLPSCLLLVFGTAWTSQATTVGLMSSCSIAGGLGALVALDRRSPRADLAASALLTAALLSFADALPLVVGAAVTLSLRGAGDWWRRAWIWATPLAIYAAWAIWARLNYPALVHRVLGLHRTPHISRGLAVLAGLD